MLERKRDLMAKILTDVGFKPIIPEGGYFMMADTSGIGKIYGYLFFYSMLYHIFGYEPSISVGLPLHSVYNYNFSYM